MLDSSAIIRDGLLETGKVGESPIPVDSERWFAWLASHHAFVLESPAGSLVARKVGAPSGKDAWRASNAHGRRASVYIGTTRSITMERLFDVARALHRREGAGSAQEADLTQSTLNAQSVGPPHPPLHVVRPRLLAVLSSVRQPVTLIAAPTGYGKTTAVADWIARSARAAAWATMVAGDNDGPCFLLSIAHALEQLNAGTATRVFQLLRNGRRRPSAAELAELVRMLVSAPRADAGGAPTLLVLDNYHLIVAPEVHALTTALLERLPPQLQVVIISRTVPPLRLPLLRTRGRLADVRAADLAFSVDEAHALLCDGYGLALARTMVAALVARTEGWAAGLQFAAQWVRSTVPSSQQIHRFSGDDGVRRYLVEEVFVDQPSDMQRFLLSTCVLESFCPELCDAVMQRRGAPPAAKLLGRAVSAGLFLTPLARDGDWYRYHALFAEALRQQLRARAPGRERILRRRAAAWYAQHDMLEEAINQLLAAQEWETAAGLIEQHADTLIQASKFDALATWLATLPPSLVHDRPLISLLHASLLERQGEVVSLEGWLPRIDINLLNRTHEETQAAGVREQLRARMTAIRAGIARLKGDQRAARAFGHQALRQLRADDHVWRVQVRLDLATVSYLDDQLEQALSAFSTVAEDARRTEQYDTVLLALHSQVAVLRDLGRLGAAEQLRIRTHEQSVDQCNVEPRVDAMGDLNQALIAIDRNQLAAAEAAIQHGHARLRSHNHPTIRILLSIANIRHALAVGDPATALRAVEAAEQALKDILRPEDTFTWRRTFIHAWRARVALARGDHDAVLRWAEAEAARPTWMGAPLAQWSYRSIPLMLARADLLTGHGEDAVRRLEPLRVRAEHVRAHDVLIEVLILLTRAHELLGARETALTLLGRAAQLGAPEGYIRPFLDEGRLIQELLSHLRTRGGAFATAADRLLARLNGGAEVLTARELQVLNLVAAGLSNHEIAQTLMVAMGTVKWHISIIHSKLGVQRRGQAVAYARELGVLNRDSVLEHAS